LIQPYSANLSQTGAPLEMLESKYSMATAIALEGFKKPKNPATNLLKGEFGKQNQGLKIIWQEWGTVLQLASFAIVILFVWSLLRDQFSTKLADRSEEAIKEQAKSVAGLRGRQANATGVKKYIRENKKKINELKSISQIAQMNSALDVLKKVSESAPGKNQVKIDIVSFIVKDEIISISGYANNLQDVNVLSESLKPMASDGVVSNQKGNLAIMPNKTSFNLSFKTDRGVSK
jgi:general secretion pathway protein L